MVGIPYVPERENIRHQEALAHDIDVAKGLLAGITRTGRQGIREVGFSKGGTLLYTLSCEEGEPTTLTGVMPGTFTEFPSTESHPDAKWFRRPLSEGQRDAIIASVIGGLGRIAQLEEVDWYGTSFREASGNAPGFRIAYLDGTELVGDMQGDCGGLGAVIASELSEVFRSVVPPNGDFDRMLTELRSLEHEFGGHLGARRNVSVASKDADSGECHLTNSEMELHAGMYESEPPIGQRVVGEREIPLSQADWDGLLDAVRKSDLPRWGDTYNQMLTFDGWWMRLVLMFDGGWGLGIYGSNLWDSRYLPIAEFLVGHGISEEEAGLSVDLLRQREETVRHVLDAIREDQSHPHVPFRPVPRPTSRPASFPRHVLFRLPSEKDLGMAHGHLIDIVRMRLAEEDNLLLGDVSISKGADDHQDAIDQDDAAPDGIVVAEDIATTEAPADENHAIGDSDIGDAIQRIREALATEGKLYPVDGEADGRHPAEPDAEPVPCPSDAMQHKEPYEAHADLYPIRGLPADGELREVQLLDIHMNGRLTHGRLTCIVPDGFPVFEELPEHDEFHQRLTAVICGIGGIEWNDLSDIIHCASHDLGFYHFEDAIRVPKDSSAWYIEVVWKDGTVSFARADRMPDGLAPLYEVLSETMVR